jgi:RND family efflux transporter MFP subunit
MFKKLRAVIVFMVVLIVGVAAVSWWLPRFLEDPKVTRLPPGVQPPGLAGSQANLPVPVRTFKAARIEFTDLLPTLGTVRGESEVELKFETPGVIRMIDFREGDLVQAGQMLSRLDERENQLRLEYARSKLLTAQTQLKLAEKRLSINERLYRLGAIILPKLEESEIEAEHARTQVTSARREMELAEHELEKNSLKAPIDGVIGTLEGDVGEYVTTQTRVATLMDIDSVYVELGIIERDIERIRMGQRVKVTVDSLPNTPFEGRIDNLAPLIEGKSRTLTAKVKVENVQGQLLPGMFARAEIAVFEKPDALVVPTSSLKDADEDGKFESVFVVDAEQAVLRPITLGYLTTDYAEVIEGLQEGEQVVTEARGQLSEGSKISLLETEESSFVRTEPSIGE